MEQLAIKDLRQELSSASGPCVSIYVEIGNTPEHRDAAARRLTRLISRAEALLTRQGSGLAQRLCSPLYAFVERLPRLPFGQGLALFRSEGIAAFTPIATKAPERTVVADSFHFKPLLAMLQAQERFHLLVCAHSSVRVFEGDRSGLKEREVLYAPYHRSEAQAASLPRTPLKNRARQVTRFYRTVDSRLLQRLRRSGEPVVIAAPPHLSALYRSASRLKTILEPIDKFASGAPTAVVELHGASWQTVERELARRRRNVAHTYHVMRLKNRTVESFEELAVAAVTGKIDTLILEKGVTVWGRLDRNSGIIERQRQQEDGPADDVMDDLAEIVLDHGGIVHLFEAGEMPTRTSAVGLTRR